MTNPRDIDPRYLEYLLQYLSSIQGEINESVEELLDEMSPGASDQYLEDEEEEYDEEIDNSEVLVARPNFEPGSFVKLEDPLAWSEEIPDPGQWVAQVQNMYWSNDCWIYGVVVCNGYIGNFLETDLASADNMVIVVDDTEVSRIPSQYIGDPACGSCLPLTAMIWADTQSFPPQGQMQGDSSTQALPPEFKP
jgi:hypothetical protein